MGSPDATAATSSTEPAQAPKLPLGYVVKSLDAALTEYVDRLLGQRYQLGRGHWQLLRTVAVYPGLKLPQLAESASAFFDGFELQGLVDELIERGWLLVAESDGELSLTADGSAGFRAMEKTQNGSSALLRKGISAEEYERVIAMMLTMIDNVKNTDPMDPEIP